MKNLLLFNSCSINCIQQLHPHHLMTQQCSKVNMNCRKRPLLKEAPSHRVLGLGSRWFVCTPHDETREIGVKGTSSKYHLVTVHVYVLRTLMIALSCVCAFQWESRHLQYLDRASSLWQHFADAAAAAAALEKHS